MSDIKLAEAAAAMGRVGGKSKSERKLKAVAENAKKGGKPKLAWSRDAEWTSVAIYAARAGWIVERHSRIQGEITGRRVLVPYSATWPEGCDLKAGWNDAISYADALIDSAEHDLSRVLRAGYPVR